eukprot:1544299-Amphidinium_carterae.4
MGCESCLRQGASKRADLPTRTLSRGVESWRTEGARDHQVLWTSSLSFPLLPRLIHAECRLAGFPIPRGYLLGSRSAPLSNHGRATASAPKPPRWPTE